MAMARYENGQTMTEYALIMSVVAVVTTVAYVTFGTRSSPLFSRVIACL